MFFFKILQQVDILHVRGVEISLCRALFLFHNGLNLSLYCWKLQNIIKFDLNITTTTIPILLARLRSMSTQSVVLEFVHHHHLHRHNHRHHHHRHHLHLAGGVEEDVNTRGFHRRWLHFHLNLNIEVIRSEVLRVFKSLMGEI